MNGNIETAFTGRVSTVPERRESKAGKAWFRFSVAVGHDEAVQWVQVACFGSIADALSDRLSKGDRVYVEGTLKLNTWSDREGKDRSGLSVAAWRCELLGQIGRNRPRKQSAPADFLEDAKHRSQSPLNAA